MKNILLALFILFFFSTSLNVSARHPCEDPRLLNAIEKMDRMASYWKNLKCASDDRLCWWFLFHVTVGESGSNAMTQFAQQVPFNFYPELGYGEFAGEAHVAQYPAYWLLKGVDLQTPLRSQSTFKQYMDRTPWAKMYVDTVSKENRVNINHELSWYWIAAAYYPELRGFIESTAPYEEACEGGHHLASLYFSGDPSFEPELNEFQVRLKQLVLPKVLPASLTQNDPYIGLKRFYALSHVFENFMLTGNKQLISKTLIDRAVEHVDMLEIHFKENYPKFRSSSEFFNTAKMDDRFFHYYYGDTLGHFRYGLKMCAGLDVVPE